MGRKAMLLACSGVAAVIAALTSRQFLLWPSAEDDVVLGETKYKIKSIVAPAASGFLLRLFAAVITGGGILGQHLRRKLLNDNRLVRLRVLAWQIQRLTRAPKLYYPMRPLSTAELAAHGSLATQADAVQKRPGRYNSIIDYHAAYNSKRTTPRKVLEAVFAALDELPPEHKAFSETVDRTILREEAEESARRYARGCPLSVFDGVPTAVKDMVMMQGLNCTKGSAQSWGSGKDAQDDVPVKRLKDVGALVLGFTTMTEFGTCPFGFSAHAKGPTNPYDTRRYPGGSSSGSAVLVSLGIVPVALGFDGGGSIRIPAAMQGLVGLKCTFGRMAVDTDECEPNVAGGPIAGNAADAALFYEVVAQPHTSSFFQRLYGSSPMPKPHYYGFNVVEDLNDVRLGFFEEWATDCDGEVQSRCYEAIDFLRSRGAQIVPIKIPHLEIMSLAHGCSISVNFTSGHEEHLIKDPRSLLPATRIQLALGGTMSGVEYEATAWIRGWSMQYIEDLFVRERLTGIITPTLATTLPRIPAAAWITGESNVTLVMQSTKYIFLANLCGLPSVSIPAGLSNDGIPIGVIVTAAHWDEHLCLRVANAMDIPPFRTTPAGWVDLLSWS